MTSSRGFRRRTSSSSVSAGDPVITRECTRYAVPCAARYWPASPASDSASHPSRWMLTRCTDLIRGEAEELEGLERPGHFTTASVGDNNTLAFRQVFGHGDDRSWAATKDLAKRGVRLVLRFKMEVSLSSQDHHIGIVGSLAGCTMPDPRCLSGLGRGRLLRSRGPHTSARTRRTRASASASSASSRSFL